MAITLLALRKTQETKGFTLVELLVVIVVIALGSAGVVLALRDTQQSQLEREALRLAALLDAARAQSLTSGVPVTWEVQNDAAVSGHADEQTMRWRGLRHKEPLPTRWLNAQTKVIEPKRLVLGPDPVLLPVRVQLALGRDRLDVVSDGVSVFSVESQP